jgi:peptidoglycan/xylan/chitin deacetylase (PgdA/CDA1 family)
MGVILVMYHYVRDVERTAHPGVAACSTRDFAGQVAHLLRHYEPVDPADLIAAVRSGSPLPENGFVLTFDDGVRDHWDNVLPVLDRHGLKGIFAPIGLPYLQGRIPLVQKNQFVRGRLGEDRLPDVYLAAAGEVAPELDVVALIENAGPGDYRRGTEKYLRFKYAVNRLIPFEVSERVLDRLFTEHVCPDEREFIRELYLDVAEIVELARAGHGIAGHSISHPSLPRLAEADQEREIAESLAWLGGLLGSPPSWFNYPYGDHDERSQRVVERLGVEIAYSTRPPIDWVSHEDRYRVPRVDTCHLPVDREAPPVELAGEIV